MKKLLPVILMSLVFIATGCQKSPIKAFDVGIPGDNQIDFNFTLLPDYQINLAGNVDIMQYGSLYFVPPTPENGTKFGVTVNTNSFIPENWLDYGPTTTLPTGVPLPNWIEGGSLVRVQVPPVQNNYVTPDVYFGIEGDYYLGIGLTFNFINDQSFPEGLSIQQIFYNKQHEPIVGGTFYGPRLNMDGTMAVPGGLFVAANLTHIIEGSYYTQHGLFVGFDDGGLSARQLYDIDKRIKKAIKNSK